MESLSDYTLIALQERAEKDCSGSVTVSHYKRTELKNNITLIEYNIEPTTSSPINSAKNFLGYFTIKKYFDSNDEQYLGDNEKQVRKKFDEKIQNKKKEQAKIIAQARQMELTRLANERKEKLNNFKLIFGSTLISLTLIILWLTGQISTFIWILIGHSTTILMIVTKRPLTTYLKVNHENVQNLENSQENPYTIPISVEICLKITIFFMVLPLIIASPLVLIIGISYGVNLGLMYLLNGCPIPLSKSTTILYTSAPVIVLSFVSGNPLVFVGGVTWGALIFSSFEWMIVIHFMTLSVMSRLLPADIRNKFRPIVQVLINNGSQLVLLVMTKVGSFIVFFVPIVIPIVGLGKGFFKGHPIKCALFSWILISLFTTILFCLKALCICFS